MMLHCVKTGMRAAFVIERIEAPSNIGQGDQTNRGVQPKPLKVIGKQSSLRSSERTVANPCEFPAENVPKLRPTLQPGPCSGQFVVSDFGGARIGAAEVWMDGPTGSKRWLIAEERSQDCGESDRPACKQGNQRRETRQKRGGLHFFE